jgi:hypothetical protein
MPGLGARSARKWARGTGVLAGAELLELDDG